jgi:pyruvate, orthophosphate dikinase
MNEKRVYTFGNGKAEGNAKMREELGGKGANLAEMNLIGVPVPPGFTITTSGTRLKIFGANLSFLAKM